MNKTVTDIESARMLIVHCSSAGNPDMGQDPRCRLSAPVSFGCKTLAEAARICRRYIADHDLGGGNWTGGEIIDRDTREVVARVSYNGRVWPPGEWTPGQDPLL